MYVIDQHQKGENITAVKKHSLIYQKKKNITVSIRAAVPSSVSILFFDSSPTPAIGRPLRLLEVTSPYTWWLESQYKGLSTPRGNNQMICIWYVYITLKSTILYVWESMTISPTSDEDLISGNWTDSGIPIILVSEKQIQNNWKEIW